MDSTEPDALEERSEGECIEEEEAIIESDEEISTVTINEEQIARQLERVMRHRAELYQLMEKVPDGPGKAAVQEHYLYRVPWGVVAERLHYGNSYTRDLARRTVEE